MQTLLRKVLWTIVLVLILIIGSVECWFSGFNSGYGMAMSDVLLEIETPENYFLKRFDIKIQQGYNNKQEQVHD